MSANSTLSAEAINLPATILLSTQEVSALLSEVRAIRGELDALSEDVPKERAFDRQRIAALEREEQPLQKYRAEVLQALLAANGGKMLAKDARKRIHLSKLRFSFLLSTLANEIESGELGKRSIG